MNALEVIAMIVDEKKARRIEPSHALLKEVLALGVTLASLQELTESGKIRLGNTLNDKYITVR